MKRHYRRHEEQQRQESSDEDDAFSSLSMLKKKKKAKEKHPKVVGASSKESDSARGSGGKNDVLARPMHPTSSAFSSSSDTKLPLPVSTTSSMKRHHGIANDQRKAKMDALLVELQAEKMSNNNKGGHCGGVFRPDKRGSFVEPGEETETTNIFVGNLAPSITEEELTNLFRQFGDLYSVKIMWPRTAEERNRNRHTGFVCFMNRPDAEDALEAYNEADPFNVGRRLMLRWGKNVKKIVKKGTGGIAVAPIAQRIKDFHGGSSVKNRSTVAGGAGGQYDDADGDDNTGKNNISPDGNIIFPAFDPDKHGPSAIRVMKPESSVRAQFITTIASFVARDGSALEDQLLLKEANNPAFAFLRCPTPEKHKREHIFYRWRVYAFCNGDGIHSWRTEPFVMFQPGGCYWIPPAIQDVAAAAAEEDAMIRKEQEMEQRKKERRLHSAVRAYATTGRQLEHRRGGPDGGTVLAKEELKDFDRLFRKNLCGSRAAICQAMAFCFEKSSAAKQISSLLKDLLLESGPTVAVESRIARLYLLSDVLFNSQQPGVRNAFLYRDAVERMAPDVFESLGKHGAGGTVGRMTMNKLATAVSCVLAAWTEWSVYNPAFMDELQARFEGRELVKEEEQQNENPGPDREQGDADGEPLDDADGEPLDEADGEPLDDADGEPLDDADGEPLDEADGEPLEDADGEPLTDEDVDGAPLDYED